MTTRVLVDTGPLVALLSRQDRFHDSCVAQLKRLSPPLLTCWPVLTEAAWLLRRNPVAIQHLLGGSDGGLISILELGQDAPSRIAAFMNRYASIGAQLADASLVYLAEREHLDTVFTLDRRDFSVYRFGDGRAFKLLPPLP